MANIYDFTDIWTDGLTNSAVKCVVTDTSSAADSALLHLEVSGGNSFKVDKGGNLLLSASTKVQFGAVEVLNDNAGVTALKNIDSIDAATAAAIGGSFYTETEVDNLLDGKATSAQGALADSAVQPPASDGKFYAYKDGSWVVLFDPAGISSGQSIVWDGTKFVAATANDPGIIT